MHHQLVEIGKHSVPEILFRKVKKTIGKLGKPKNTLEKLRKAYGSPLLSRGERQLAEIGKQPLCISSSELQIVTNLADIFV